MTAIESSTAKVHVGSFAELAAGPPRVISAGGRSIVLLVAEGRIHALDNRCPHMGFPLSRGTVRDGILTCHWHHARFALDGGSTFDPFADDVDSFAVEIRDGEVWLDPTPRESDRRGHGMRQLAHGLEQNLPLVLAKAVIGLHELGAMPCALEQAALFAARNRAAGWSSGLSILAAMANVEPLLHPADRPRALHQALVHAALSTANQPPRFALRPLASCEQRPGVYRDWFRRFIATRSEPAAERCLRTAIAIGSTPQQVADMVFAACTDHVFLGVGHALDFANKAFELLDRIGWQHAEDLLPSLVPVLARAQRMEETASWRHPVDLPRLLDETDLQLDAALAAGGERAQDWDRHRALAETILDEDPETSLRAMIGDVRAGAPLPELAAAVAYAAARRAAHFHTANEFGDWDTVHHTLTYAHATLQAMLRSPSRELARGIFHGAASVYLDRFLNVPKQRLPGGDGQSLGSDATLDAVLAGFDRHQAVDETARLVAQMLSAGRRDEVVAVLGTALLREDAGFHEFQIYEACVRLARHFAGRPEADHVLIGAARFLSAHAPTARAISQTYDTAARLQRGETLHGPTAEVPLVAERGAS